jgi:hypothetical protein
MVTLEDREGTGTIGLIAVAPGREGKGLGLFLVRAAQGWFADEGFRRGRVVTQAANDLNFTFVIYESQGDRLVRQLHERLIQSIGSDRVLGPTWQQLFAEKKPAAQALNWWEEPRKRLRLIDIAAREAAAFVYDAATLDAAIAALQGVRSVTRWAYSMKANGHPQILRRMYEAGLTLECVSQGELEHAFAVVPDLDPERVLFTPNFAPRAEYEYGFAKGVRVTLDNLYPLKMWPEVFRGRELFVRIDPGFGRGHHQHVRPGMVACPADEHPNDIIHCHPLLHTHNTVQRPRNCTQARQTYVFWRGCESNWVDRVQQKERSKEER